MRLIIALMLAGFAGSASAQTLPADIPLNLIAVTPDQILFQDARPGRSSSSVEEATIVTIHVMRAPLTVAGKPAVAVMRGWTFSCLKPEVTQIMQSALSEDGTILQSINRELKGQYQPGTVTEDMSVVACDGWNPRGHTETFTGLKAALAFARTKFAGQ